MAGVVGFSHLAAMRWHWVSQRGMSHQRQLRSEARLRLIGGPRFSCSGCSRSAIMRRARIAPLRRIVHQAASDSGRDCESCRKHKQSPSRGDSHGLFANGLFSRPTPTFEVGEQGRSRPLGRRVQAPNSNPFGCSIFGSHAEDCNGRRAPFCDPAARVSHGPSWSRCGVRAVCLFGRAIDIGLIGELKRYMRDRPSPYN